jgi:hypothetical protein
MNTGKGWRLRRKNGPIFKAALVKRLKVGEEDIAIFRVLPNPAEKRG